MQKKRKVIIVGGGFGGIATAKEFIRANDDNLDVTLISDKMHFEYHPRLYKVVNGFLPLQECILLSQIFDKKNNIDITHDKIVKVDLARRNLLGESGNRYFYDLLILALGSQTTYFGIEGLEKYAFGFKSIEEALRLKQHLHKIIGEAKEYADITEKVKLCRILVVGAGASGVELSGELTDYSKKIAKFHNVDPDLVTIDLIEAAPRILPAIDKKIAQRAEKHLRSLGVNIFTNRMVVKEDIEEVVLKDMSLSSQTLIWTAGVMPNVLYSNIKGLSLDKRGRVVVNKNMLARGTKNIFVIGDGASTKYCGMAQTAIADGRYVAKKILGLAKTSNLVKKPYFSIPVGNKWAISQVKNMIFFGRIGWWIRRLADLRYLLSILPLHKAIKIFRYSTSLSESCSVCAKGNTKNE